MRSVRNRAAASPEAHAAARVVADQDSSVARDEVLGGGIERKPCFAQQRLQDAPGSGARRRRDRGGRAAAVRRRPRRKLGIADAHRDLLGAKPENFGDGLRHDRAGAGADVLHAREHLDRAVAHHAHLAGRIDLHIGHPERLRYAKAALYRTRIGARARAGAASRSARRRCAALRAAPGSDRCARAATSGSMASRSANSSIACSRPKAPGVLPGARIAQPGPALMNTSCCAPSKFGQS